MDHSLSITITLEGGTPSLYLAVQDHYHSPSQAFFVPIEFIDIGALLHSAQQSGENWLVTATPENPRFQIESPILVRHQDNRIYWDFIYEHYEPFLNIELTLEDDDYEENIITFCFEPFQYISALYQGFQACQHLHPTTYHLPIDAPTTKATEGKKEARTPEQKMKSFLPTLLALWQKYGKHNNRVVNGQATADHDFFAQEAEALWLHDLLNALGSNPTDQFIDNLEAYLDSLPDSALDKIDYRHEKLDQMLASRWEALVHSLTEDEADALEQGESHQRYPNSLKLRLMQEFLNGNPSILLGQYLLSQYESPRANVVDLAHWRGQREAEPF